MKLTGLILSFAFLFAGMAQARNAYYTKNYYVNLHFDNTFFGERVKNIMAHVGVEREGRWTSVVDVTLAFHDSYNQFDGKTNISDVYDSSARPSSLKVTYKVTLENGKEIWTLVTDIPVESYGTFYEGCHEDRSDCFSDKAYRMIEELRSTFTHEVPRVTQAYSYTLYH